MWSLVRRCSTSVRGAATFLEGSVPGSARLLDGTADHTTAQAVVSSTAGVVTIAPGGSDGESHPTNANSNSTLEQHLNTSRVMVSDSANQVEPCARFVICWRVSRTSNLINRVNCWAPNGSGTIPMFDGADRVDCCDSAAAIE
jgi:hypothetical protein